MSVVFVCSHPESAGDISSSLQMLDAAWDELQQLAARRTKLLDEAIAEHKFDDTLKVSTNARQFRLYVYGDKVQFHLYVKTTYTDCEVLQLHTCLFLFLNILRCFNDLQILIQELEGWVSETVKRMDSAEPPESVADAEALLEVHHERKVSPHYNLFTNS